MVVKPIRDGSGRRTTIGGILSCEARSELLAVALGAAMEMEAASFFWSQVTSARFTVSDPTTSPPLSRQLREASRDDPLSRV